MAEPPELPRGRGPRERRHPGTVVLGGLGVSLATAVLVTGAAVAYGIAVTVDQQRVVAFPVLAAMADRLITWAAPPIALLLTFLVARRLGRNLDGFGSGHGALLGLVASLADVAAAVATVGSPWAVFALPLLLAGVGNLGGAVGERARHYAALTGRRPLRSRR